MAFGFFKVIKGLVIRKENTLNPDQIEIIPDGTAGTTTTIESSQTVDRTITLPDATTTLVGTNATQTLTNKSIDADANTITNIDNSDIKSGAAIAKDKLAAGTANRVSVTDASGFLVESTVTDTDLLVLGGLAGDTLVTTTGTQVLTNKSIDADLNTITNIENADIKVGAAIDATKIATGAVDNTEFGYLSGVTSAIQTQLDGKINDTGDTMTGDLNMSGTQRVVNMADPVSAQDAATKQYVDNIAAGLDPKESVRVATTADLGASYATTPNNGRFTSAPSTIDGVALSIGDRVLVKDQTDAKQNGIYTYTAANQLTRSADMDGSPASEVSAGNYTFTTAGSINVARGYVITGNGILTLNTDNINWTQFSGASNAALRDLSNLTSPTAINQDLLPDTDNTRDLGSSTNRYAETHTQSVINTGANLTLQSTTGKVVLSGTSVNTPSASTDPGTPAEDDLYYNTALDKFKYYDGTQWRQVATKDESNFILNGYADSSTTGWAAYNDTQTVTITIATPAVFTVGSTTGLYVGMPVIFTTTGALPTGLVSGTTYFISAIPSGTTFRVSATLGGADVNTSGTQSGVHTFRPGVPVDATGGTANITFAASATSPLSGQNSFILTKDAAIREGEGVSYSFTIDDASKSKVLQIQFDYLVNSGTFVAGGPTTDSDILVYILDVTNSRLIQPTTYKLFSTSSTIADKFISNFQTSADSTSYRLIFHVASNSASAYSLKIDNVVVSPTTISYGTPITDWSTYTPTFTGFGTPTSVQFIARRVGSDAEVIGKFIAGTTTATEARITLPFSATSAGSPILTSIQAVGLGTYTNATDSQIRVLIEPSVNYMTFGFQSATQAGLSKVFGSGLVSSGNTVQFFAKFPIQGWSAQVQSSDVNDQRIVAAYYRTSSNKSTNSTLPIDYDTRILDTHAAVTGTGTGSWRFTAPISGTYEVKTTSLSASGATALGLYRNGTVYALLSSIFTSDSRAGVALVNLNAGDFIDARAFASITATGSADVLNANFISITRVANPASITSTETVAASYWVSSTFAASTTTPCNFDSREYDTHNAVTTSPTAWRFTAPVSGLYNIGGHINLSASAQVKLYKNGTDYKRIGFADTISTTSPNCTIRLNAGEFIDIRPSSAASFTGGALNSNTQSFIEITKVGI